MKRQASPWFLVGLLCFTASAGYLLRVNLSIAAPLLMKEFHFTELEIGRLFSSFLIGYALCQAWGGILADRWGPVKTFRRTSLCWIVLTIIFTLIGIGYSGEMAPIALFSGMLLRFLLGITQAPLYPTTAAAVALWTSPQIRSRSNAVVLASVSIGSAVAPVLISSTMGWWGWRTALLLSTLPAVAACLYWWIKPVSYELPEKDASAAKVMDSLLQPKTGRSRKYLHSPSFLLLCSSYTFQGYVGYIFIFWFYLYLVRVRKFDLLEGAFFTSLPWVLSMISIPLGGWISDKLAGGRLGRQWGRKIVPMIGLSGAGILLAFGAGTSSPYFAAVLLSLSTALVLCVEGPFWAAVTDIAGEKHAGTGGGIMNTGCNLGGMLSPVATPWLAERIGWENALYIAAVLSLAAGLIWLGIRFPDPFIEDRLEKKQKP